jgi:hypothetical protein
MVLELILAFGLGAVGSFFMWLLVGGRIVGRQIIEKGGEAALSWMDEAIPDNPKAPPHPAVQKFARYMSHHVAQSIYGAFGNIEQKLEKELENVDVSQLMKSGIPGGSMDGLLGALMGGDDSKNPMSSTAGVFNLVKLIQTATSGGNGGPGGTGPAGGYEW